MAYKVFLLAFSLSFLAFVYGQDVLDAGDLWGNAQHGVTDVQGEREASSTYSYYV